MRVPLSWLADYVDLDLDVEDLAAGLTRLGLQVEGIQRVGDGWRGVVVGELLEVRPHPSAGRLSLTRVTVGAGEPLDIVCGATNISAGQRVPVALPGSVLPGGRRIELTRIQGADSNGMLCSGAELELSADADGIFILDDDARLGTPLEEIVGDTVLDVDVKPNRGDLLSLVGLAREVAALTGARVRWPSIEVPEGGDTSADHLEVGIEAADLCSRFVGRYVHGLSVGAAPLKVQLRLMAAGMRPVSNVVDASNYVMLELGKPIHTFDAAAVADGRIVVRRAHRGERIRTLDHVERELSTDDLLIADPGGPLGIAGVMGGATSEVGEGTKAVVVESAIFDPVAIRRTAQRHALRSEASQRFEKGQEWRLARLGADRTAQLLAAWAGGRPAVGVVDTNPVDEQPTRLAFRPARVNRLLGARLSAAEMRDLLRRVEIATEQPEDGANLRVPVVVGDAPMDAAAQDGLVAVVPTHRRDMVIEADVAEEIARLHGYEQLPVYLPASQTPPHRPDPRRFVDQLRELLAGRGLSEMISHVLVGPADHARLGFPADDPATIRLSNPISADRSEMRRSMLPGLTAALVVNERQRRENVALFELGPVHEYRDGQPWQSGRLAIVLAGNLQPLGWAEQPRAADVADAKGLLEWLAERLCHRRLSYRVAEPLVAVEHPGRTAEVVLAEHGSDGAQRSIGRVGELDPRYLRQAGVRAERAIVAVIDLEALESSARQPALGRVAAQLVDRDLAVVVGEATPSSDVEQLIRQVAGEQLHDVVLFDRYRGRPLADDEISLAYRLVVGIADPATAETELDGLVEAIGGRLRQEVGARIRGLDGA
ncbi:MAG TPA: phenylalanine--tRNA ligase subunit beta [Candidatus Limnocylindrales bacterium]|nr:phenylalanine--tRNA ligase subunit beta [Candidatus Limnocylindrales bacterium]